MQGLPNGDSSWLEQDHADSSLLSGSEDELNTIESQSPVVTDGKRKRNSHPNRYGKRLLGVNNLNTSSSSEAADQDRPPARCTFRSTASWLTDEEPEDVSMKDADSPMHTEESKNPGQDADDANNNALNCLFQNLQIPEADKLRRKPLLADHSVQAEVFDDRMEEGSQEVVESEEMVVDSTNTGPTSY
ncbi:unnamed protein product, partial [Mesorhabditis spiculigera]